MSTDAGVGVGFGTIDLEPEALPASAASEHLVPVLAAKQTDRYQDDEDWVD
jgi:hypothetical protein